MVGLGGLEPPTSPLSGVRSNQLSYGPMRQRRPPSLRKRHGRGRHEPAQANSHGKQTPARLYPIDERT